MILPVGDAPNPRGFRPWVTWLLIALNVLVFLGLTLPLGQAPATPTHPRMPEYLAWLATVAPAGTSAAELASRVTAYDLFVFGFGFRPSDPSPTTLLSAMFLHSGLLHLAGNLLFLWIYGDNVEHRLGRLGYLAAYLGCGAAATLGYAALAQGSGTPLIGASGAISGVLGFYFVFFPANHVRLLFLLPPFFFRSFLVSARLVLGAYVLLDNLVPYLFGQGGSGIAYGAHIGGFVAGALAAAALGGWARARGLRGQAGAGADAAGPSLEAAIAAGDRDQALAALPGASRAALAALGPDARTRLGTWLAEAGRPAAGVALLRPVARRRDAAGARAALQLGRVLLTEGQPAAAYAPLLRAARQEADPAVAQVAADLVSRLVDR